jgi:1-acyl-sn-glycerol-3-phosphate acyltransferase
MKYLYNLYQLLIALPIIVIDTVVICTAIIIGCALGFGHFWANYPPRLWARIILWALLIPVKVEGRHRLDPKESYVFVANHQGAFDIFLIYGHLNRHFKWMMKYQLKKIPFVGFACMKSHQIFVDKRGPKKIKATYDQARQTLQGGTSLTVWPAAGYVSRFSGKHLIIINRDATAYDHNADLVFQGDTLHFEKRSSLSFVVIRITIGYKLVKILFFVIDESHRFRHLASLNLTELALPHANKL